MWTGGEMGIMPKVYCATIECKYWKDNNTCGAKEISLSDHSVMTLYDGRQHFHKCKSFEESEEAAEIRRFLEQLKPEHKENENNVAF